MKKTLLLFLTLLLCSSCGISKETELEFKRKQACAQYKDKIEKEIQVNYQNFEVAKNWKLEEIFYSPIVNTCFYVATSENQFDKDLIDFFSKKIYFSQIKGINVNGEFENKLLELKGDKKSL